MNLLLILLACGPAPGPSLEPVPPSLGLSPSLSTLGPTAPGATETATIQLDNNGRSVATLFYEVIDDLDPGPQLTQEPPLELGVDDTTEVVFTWSPSQPGSAITWLHVSTDGDDPCADAWAVVRAAASGDCGADDQDCDGQFASAGDCADDDPWVGLGFPEVCDGVDNDCDGQIDPDCEAVCGHPPR